MIRKAVIIVITLLIILVIISLGRQIIGALQAGDRLDTTTERLVRLQQENRLLKEKLKDTQRLDFIEEQARDKLGLAKENEVIVIIPESEVKKVLSLNKGKEEIKLSNWQGWLKLFGFY
ncbi:septum formation initiator family protein [Candidatus Daviesbacteria bacterium]|nr:septum formation initiator family protein [Candidatus Daviesbacteria bacterium]